ncbi:protein FAM209B [Echinops telfairi]|uniref:Protein FAM209B n=1 Tax=Echinops telfairi TaxID=9371 RepID=A0ABM0IEP9_ECHTE|nr:protein FAM209B [Echinops telfairi]
MCTLKWLLFLPLCLSCSYAFMFSSLKEKAPEAQGKVPCGRHFRTRQELPEGTKGPVIPVSPHGGVTAGSTGMQIQLEGGWCVDQNPSGPRGCPLRSPQKKIQSTSPSKDYAFNTLTQLEMDLVKFVSKVRELKDSVASPSLKAQQGDLPLDQLNNVTIYEIWGEEYPE